jgi:hypothetical protein
MEGQRDDDAESDAGRAAGDFGSWLSEVLGAIRGENPSDVPCDGCTACCRSGQFVHIAPDEVDAIAHIPPALLFPAPRLPKGHVLMGYDAQGRCPMLVDDRCTIYAHRPRTCRTYDCRVLPAAGLELDEAERQPLIAARAREWRFTHPSVSDRSLHAAVRAAATYVADHGDALPEGTNVATATGRAVVAIEAHRAFLGAEPPEPAAVRVELISRSQRTTAP